MSAKIYFDNSATTRVCERAMSKAFEMMGECYSNPSSLYNFGMQSEQEILSARTNVASWLGCKSDEVYFTSGGTESNNTAVFGVCDAGRRVGNHIVTTTVEHPSVLAPFEQLEKRGWQVTYVSPSGDDEAFAQSIVAACTDETVLVSVMAVNNEIGTIFNVSDIAARVKKAYPKVIFHTDAVQCVSKKKINLAQTKIDLLSMSGHKMHAPKGIGVLYIRRGTKVTPLMFGGGQEKNFRSGTENVPAICALGVACADLCENHGEYGAHIEALYTYFLEQCKKRPQLALNSPDFGRAVPYIINVSAEGVPSEVMLNFLAGYNVFVSSGSACARGVSSHVLKAVNLPQNRINSALRVSFSRYNTIDEIDYFFKILDLGINKLVKKR